MGKIENPDNIKDTILEPERAEFFAWSEAAPERCLIVTDRDFRWEGFSSPFEFIQWLRMVVPEKEEILQDVIDYAAAKWEAEYGKKIPASRRK